MADQEPGKLTASLEELSLKKQLPLRQQVQKPMLKYSNSVIRPVQLFNHADLVTIRNNAEAARNAYSSLSQASGASAITAPFRSSGKPSPSPQTLLKQATGNNVASVANTPASPVATPKSGQAHGHSNPYARPLSAKDIVSDLQNQKVVKKTPNFSQLNSGGGVGGSGSGTPMFGFQMNAFMRPQSAMRKEPPAPKPQPKASITPDTADKTAAKNNENEHDEQETISQVSNGDFSPRRNIPPTKLERETDLSDTYPSSRSSTQAAVKNQFGPAKPRSAVSANVSKNINSSVASSHSDKPSPSRVTSASQTASSAISKTNDDKHYSKVVVKNDSGPNLPTKSVIYAKPVSSLPRPGSAAPSSSKSSTPESQKVRNLNYTPTKPYSEVMNPSQPLTAKPPISVITKTQQTTATAISVKPESAPTSNFISSPDKSAAIKHPASAASSRSSRHSSASSSTQYYRKISKGDTLLHEQRPPAIGAPSKVRQLLEKDSITSLTGSENGGDDEEEESVGVPSGERLPGDGEASVYDDDDEFVDEEDDAIDNLDDDCIGGSDGESDGYSFTSSSLSRRSSSAQLRFKSRPCSGASVEPLRYSRPTTATPEKAKPGLTKSHFSKIPPTINFVAEGEKVEQLPWDLRKFMKWRLSPITPNVVKGSLARVGFRITKRNHDWLGCWGKHMKSPGFKSLREYQKLNHFPGSFQIGRKDKLWRNLSKMQVHFGKKEFGFFPQTYCLPFDSKLLKRAWEDGGNKQKWIIKPPASARGIGIKVISKWTQIPRRRPVIVQKYLARPYLINDSKFDLRVYVYISCYDPLRLYVYEDGLARFASMKYSSSMKNLNNKFMHLTNYSVNKKNSDYQANADETVCQGHKWSLKALWNYMKRQGLNTAVIWDSIKDLIVKTIICSDGPVNSLVKANCKNRYCVHELFGFDVLLDENLKPWILEVNISPSLHSNSQLDVNIKGHMIKDLMNIAGFRIPDKHDVNQHDRPGNFSQTDLSLYVPPNDYCMDKRLFSQQLSPDERAKHAYYSQRHQDDHTVQSILETLTPDDIRCLTESIDEDGRKGGYQRVFPTPSTHKYLKFFETARYYNLLLDQWVQRYNRMEQRGIALLDGFCEEGIHLEMNTESHHHQWNPPNASCHSFREPRLLSAPVSKTKEEAHLKTRQHSFYL